MGEVVERIDVDLLAECGGGFVEFLLLDLNDAEIVVGVGVEGIEIELLSKGGDG